MKLSTEDLELFCKGHTTGEWSLPHFALNDKEGCQCGYVFAGEGESTICEVFETKEKDKYDEYPSHDEAVGNANLITLAPQLLKEVIELRKVNADLLSRIEKALFWKNRGKLANLETELENSLRSNYDNCEHFYLFERNREPNS